MSRQPSGQTAASAGGASPADVAPRTRRGTSGCRSPPAPRTSRSARRSSCRSCSRPGRAAVSRSSCLPSPGEDPLEDLRRPRRALAALGALGARLVGVEAREPRRSAYDHVGASSITITPPEPSIVPLRDDALVVQQRRLGLLARHDRHRRAAGDDRLERPARAQARRQVVDEVLDREAHRHFVVAGPLHVAAHREELGAGALRVAESRAPCTTRRRGSGCAAPRPASRRC